MEATPLWKKIVEVSEDNAILSTLKNDFTSFIAKVFLYRNLRKLDKENYLELSYLEKKEIGTEILDNIYKDYSAKMSNLKKAEFFFKLAINESNKRIKKKINGAPLIVVENVEVVKKEEFEKILKNLDSDGYFKEVFKSKNLVNGFVLVLLEVHDSNSFASELLMSMLGAIPKKDTLNAKNQAVKDFLNMYTKEFSDATSNIFLDNLGLTHITNDELKKAYLYDKNFVEPSEIIKTDLDIKVSNNKFKIEVYLFVDNFSKTIEDLVFSKSKQKDVFEESPPVILAKRTNDINKDLENLFLLLNLSKLDLDFILEKVGKESFDDFSISDITSFNQVLINDFFKNASQNKKKSIMANISFVFDR